MYPISELGRLNLAAKGFQLSPSQIFNPDAVSLVDGICRVNGCTGSFVSDAGLIITNHHCAFDAIQKASTKDRDLLANGFVASNLTEEVPAPGYTVRITEQYRDVSHDVLSKIDPQLDAMARAKVIEKRRKEIEKESESANPGLRAEVAEMFAGKTYVLFLYTYLKDIRLVFAPPVSIGAFGGENDNWEWPRHTGDFSFMRAYTAPDGSSAEFSKENVPYRPKRPIQVAPGGANEEDLVFILGYPGRTLRQRTASYFQFEETLRLPETVDYYAWQMKEMESDWQGNREVAIKHATRFKSLANVEKRSRGQLLGLKRTGLTEKRRGEEAKLKQFIDANPERAEKYQAVLPSIDRVYADWTNTARQEMALRELRTACRAMSFAFTIVDGVHELAKEDLDREAPFMNRNLALTTQQLKLDIADWHPPTDERILNGMIERLRRFPTDTLPVEVAQWLQVANPTSDRVASMFRASKLANPDWAASLLKKSPEELHRIDDPFLQSMIELYPAYKALRDKDKERDGELGRLYSELQDMRQLYQKESFIPDANATLRLTYGFVRGYSPADAVIRTPVSTLRGVIEKTTGEDPYITPPEVLERYHAKQFGNYVHPKLQQVPVAILYNTDTTGGNSGSPVLNAKGELVAVNFDRTFEATINDFAWNESYSRSIGVDVRYVLWVTGVVYKADHLLREMGVAPSNP